MFWGKQTAVLLLLGLFAVPLSLPHSGARAAPPDASQTAVKQVLLEKSDRKLTLFDGDGNPVRAYRVALGKNPVGKKEYEGDGKTPEGRYVIDARNEKSDYFLSLRISYPAQKDYEMARRVGKSPGGAIFIHGQPNGKAWQHWKYGNRRDWTQGCIALMDKDMKEIWNMIADGTPITIVP